MARGIIEGGGFQPNFIKQSFKRTGQLSEAMPAGHTGHVNQKSDFAAEVFQPERSRRRVGAIQELLTGLTQAISNSRNLFHKIAADAADKSGCTFRLPGSVQGIMSNR